MQHLWAFHPQRTLGLNAFGCPGYESCHRLQCLLRREPAKPLDARSQQVTIAWVRFDDEQPIRKPPCAIGHSSKQRARLDGGVSVARNGDGARHVQRKFRRGRRVCPRGSFIHHIQKSRPSLIREALFRRHPHIAQVRQVVAHPFRRKRARLRRCGQPGRGRTEEGDVTRREYSSHAAIRHTRLRRRNTPRRVQEGARETHGRSGDSAELNAEPPQVRKEGFNGPAD
jgi:hypothetical protein